MLDCVDDRFISGLELVLFGLLVIRVFGFFKDC